MISEYRKILEQKNSQTQNQTQNPMMPGIPQMNQFMQPFQPLNMPPKAPTQPQVVIQNPKYSANKSHKEYQPFYIPAPVENPNQKTEKNEIKRENVDHLVVFKKNFQEVLPSGVQIFNQLQLCCERADPQLVIQIGKKYLQDFEKVFRDQKGFDKKRSQLVKTLKGVQEICRKIKDPKKLKSLADGETPKFDLLKELDEGLDLEVAEHFIDFSKYAFKPVKSYAKAEVTESGQALFNQCLQLIE